MPMWCVRLQRPLKPRTKMGDTDRSERMKVGPENVIGLTRTRPNRGTQSCYDILLRTIRTHSHD